MYLALDTAIKKYYNEYFNYKKAMSISRSSPLVCNYLILTYFSVWYLQFGHVMVWSLSAGNRAEAETSAGALQRSDPPPLTSSLAFASSFSSFCF